MRKSGLLNKLRSGKIVSSMKLNPGDGQVAELAAWAGFNCLWLDRKHVSHGWSVLNVQNWAAKAYDVDAAVTFSCGGYSDYIKPLEVDAAGIIVPHIMSLEDAKNVVGRTRFFSAGRRPVDGGNTDGLYTNLYFNDYIRQANQHRFIILQIEDSESLEVLDAIANLEEYDMLFFGPGDFSHAIGSPGKWDHTELISAYELVQKRQIDMENMLILSEIRIIPGNCL